MRAKREDIAEAIYRQTQDKNFAYKKLSQEVAAYLLTTGRPNELNSIMRDVMKKRIKSGIVEVVATTAHPLTPELKKQIEDTIKELYPNAKKVIITEVHEPNLIGGVQLDLPDKHLNLSLRTKLDKFKYSIKSRGE